MNSIAQRKRYLYTIVLAAIMTTVITICSWISIPTLVPFTLQTLAIFTIFLAAGGFIGTISVVVYCLLGLIGIPVFAGFTSGPAKLIGPTGGFILGFIISGLIFWVSDRLIPHMKGIKNYIRSTILILISDIVLYAFGIFWFMTVYVNADGIHPSFASAISACLIPFIIPDLAKIVVSIILGTKLRPYVKKY